METLQEAPATTPTAPPETVDPVVRAEALSKRFGDVVAVDDVSFALERGTVTGFLGPNGAGKTTTLRMLLDLVEPTAGSALVFGRRYRGSSSSAAPRGGGYSLGMRFAVCGSHSRPTESGRRSSAATSSMSRAQRPSESASWRSRRAFHCTSWRRDHRASRTSSSS